MPPRTAPPFRADHVGSLLRTRSLKEARARHEKGGVSAVELKAIEDREIAAAIKKQEEIGLRAVTDGEFRRAFWNYDFLGALPGVEAYLGERKIKFQGVNPKPMMLRVTGKLGTLTAHPMLDHFKFVREHAKATPKMTIPSPSVMHFRGGRQAIDKKAYPEMGAYFDDLAKLYGKAIKAFYDAGCRYLQLDDTVWAYLCSREQLDQARARGEDADKLAGIYAKTINTALKSKPADMTITTHVCRGNFRSTWISEGGYEPVADLLLGGVDYDGFFLEYDTERAGGFEPLRFVPKGNKQIVLGLVTSKSGTLEKKDDIKKRIDEASKYVAHEQLCLSPQCGFASTEEGNVLTEQAQWNKMKMIREISQEVWG